MNIVDIHQMNIVVDIDHYYILVPGAVGPIKYYTKSFGFESNIGIIKYTAVIEQLRVMTHSGCQAFSGSWSSHMILYLLIL